MLPRAYVCGLIQTEERDDMAMSKDDLLREAKLCLAIAESKDAKREAYKRAANAMVAYRKETRCTITLLASNVGRDKSFISRLLKWQESGFKAETPFLMDEQATERASISHTKKVLREQPMEQIERIMEDLPAPRVAKIAQAALGRTGVPREMAKDNEASATVTRASGAIHEQRSSDHKRRSRPEQGSVMGGMEFLAEVGGNLIKAKRSLADAYEKARDLDLTDDQREAALEMLDEVEGVVTWLRSYLKSGDRSFETELQELLSDG